MMTQNKRITLLALYSISRVAASDALGIWKVNPVLSTAPYSNITAIGFQSHAKGEVFTLYRSDGDGRATTSSTILYFDGRDRDMEDFGCQGTQSSRRVDRGTVEIARNCTGGQHIRLIRRLSPLHNELILEVSVETKGDRVDRQMVQRRK
jgi:hypothetical protein